MYTKHHQKRDMLCVRMNWFWKKANRFCFYRVSSKIIHTVKRWRTSTIKRSINGSHVVTRYFYVVVVFIFIATLSDIIAACLGFWVILWKPESVDGVNILQVIWRRKTTLSIFVLIEREISMQNVFVWTLKCHCDCETLLIITFYV